MVGVDWRRGPGRFLSAAGRSPNHSVLDRFSVPSSDPRPMNSSVWPGAAVGTFYALVCLGAGALVLRALRRWLPRSSQVAESLALSFALGHLVLGTTWTLVALGGGFDERVVLGACTAVAVASAVLGARGALKTVRLPGRGERPPSVGVMVAVMVGLLILLRAMYPPTNDDALRAYLVTPRVVAESHRLAFQPFNTFVVWPLLAEMNTAVTLLLGNETAATVFDAWVALALLAALLALSERAGVSRLGGGVAVLTMLSSSAFLNLAGAGKVDIAGSMYGILAAGACLQSRGGALWLSGLLFGSAMAVKSSNLLLGPGLLILLWRGGNSFPFRALLSFGSAAALALVPQLWKTARLVRGCMIMLGL